MSLAQKLYQWLVTHDEPDDSLTLVIDDGHMTVFADVERADLSWSETGSGPTDYCIEVTAESIATTEQ